MCDSVVDGIRRMLEEVGEADVQSALAETNGGVQRGEAAEADVEGRDGRPRPQAAILFLKDGDERGEHGDSRLTCCFGRSILLRDCAEATSQKTLYLFSER